MGANLPVIIQQLVNGLALGSVYALIALGYTMVYGIVRLINFAHGDIFMLGAYYGYYLIKGLKMSPVAAIPVAVLLAVATVAAIGGVVIQAQRKQGKARSLALVLGIAAVVAVLGWLILTMGFKLPFVVAMPLAMLMAAMTGMTIEKLAYKPLRKAPRIAALITAIGVSLLLQNVGLKVFEARPKPYPPIMDIKIWDIGGVIISNMQLVMLGTAVTLMILLSVIVYRTKIGKAMRAVSFDKDAARLMGIDVDTIISVTFALGSALAAAGGILVGFYYNRIMPNMGVMYGLKAFVAAVVGGIGYIPGAMAGGMLMGLSEVLVIGVGWSTLKDAIAFVILIIILLVKPAGLFGKAGREKV